MKQWLLIGVLAIGCGSKSAPPQPAPPVAPAPGSAATATDPPATPDKPPVMMAGAYAADDVNSDEAKQQAAKAIELLRVAKNDSSIQLAAVRTFSKQVVAGMNYKLGLDLTTAAGPRKVDVVLFVGLDHHAELSSIAGI